MRLSARLSWCAFPGSACGLSDILAKKVFGSRQRQPIPYPATQPVYISHLAGCGGCPLIAVATCRRSRGLRAPRQIIALRRVTATLDLPLIIVFSRITRFAFSRTSAFGFARRARLPLSDVAGVLWFILAHGCSFQSSGLKWTLEERERSVVREITCRRAKKAVNSTNFGTIQHSRCCHAIAGRSG